MSKLKLVANPTFKSVVAIPTAGAAPSDVEFTFRHRTRDALKEFLDKQADDVDAVLQMACAWDLEEAFDKNSVETLVQNHLGATKAIFDKYMDELTKGRLGN